MDIEFEVTPEMCAALDVAHDAFFDDLAQYGDDDEPAEAAATSGWRMPRYLDEQVIAQQLTDLLLLKCDGFTPKAYQITDDGIRVVRALRFNDVPADDEDTEPIQTLDFSTPPSTITLDFVSYAHLQNLVSHYGVALRTIVDGENDDELGSCRYCGAAQLPFKDGVEHDIDSGDDPDEWRVVHHESWCPSRIAATALSEVKHGH